MPLSPRVQSWLQSSCDETTKREIRRLMEEDPQGLSDAFFSTLSFGTGGIRALMGVGSNRLNRYTIRMITQGLSLHLLKKKGVGCKVVIGFDSRHHSEEFATEAASVLCANGIEVHLLRELRPVGYVSFACRYLGCDAGIMITASHNPKEYNGYKVYGSDGSQVVPPEDGEITKEIDLITSIDQAKVLDSPLDQHPLLHRVEPSFDTHYLEAIFPLQHFPEQNREMGKEVQIVYTSLHGTGITIVPRALASWGFSSIHYVEQQIIPNGDFPTVAFPNPEYPEALSLGIKALEQTGSDLLLANDPDADRMGVVVRHQGRSIPLTGNEMAAICVAFLSEVLTQQHKLPKRGAFVTTIVTTALLGEIAKSYQIPCFEVFTGFKFIAEKIREWETKPNGYSFLFGAEESYGCLLGTYARDKDAITGSCLIAEIALFAKRQNKTLIDLLHEIYRKHGVYQERQHSLGFASGEEGMQKMRFFMQTLRQYPPQEVAGIGVVKVQDYLLSSGMDVLTFFLEEGSKLTIRPSGTEPKIKIYAATMERSFTSVESGIQLCEAKLSRLIQNLS